jgi:Putative adhesin
MSTTPTLRRTRPTRVIATLSILVIIAIIGGAILVAQTMRSSTTTDETFTLDPGSSSLDVDIDRGQVLLTAGTGDRLEVRRTVRDAGRPPMVEERADADGASLRSRCPALSERACSISYEIAIPPGYVIDVAAGTAQVEVHGLTVKKLQIDASSGSTRMEDAQGSVEINSTSGSITGTRLGLSEFVAHVGSGKTSMDFTLPPERVTATTSSGAVTIRLPAGGGPYRVTANSASGEEDVQVPTDPASSRHIDVSSSSGDVHVLPQ